MSGGGGEVMIVWKGPCPTLLLLTLWGSEVRELLASVFIHVCVREHASQHKMCEHLYLILFQQTFIIFSK